MKELVDKIKQNGYWKVTIRPTIFKRDRISTIEDCKKIIESCVVSLRGWNYPHINKEGMKVSGNDSIESHCDWQSGGYFEYWRFYQSGQFVHYFSMREDYRIDEKKLKEIKRNNNTESTSFLSILSTLYSVTEIFEFSQRLASKDVLGESAEVVIELNDVEGRELFFWNPMRSLITNYICTFREENILVKRAASKEQLISSSDKIALDACMEIFRKFNWLQVSEKVFQEDQKNFLEKRL